MDLFTEFEKFLNSIDEVQEEINKKESFNLNPAHIGQTFSTLIDIDNGINDYLRKISTPLASMYNKVKSLSDRSSFIPLYDHLEEISKQMISFQNLYNKKYSAFKYFQLDNFDMDSMPKDVASLINNVKSIFRQVTIGVKKFRNDLIDFLPLDQSTAIDISQDVVKSLPAESFLRKQYHKEKRKFKSKLNKEKKNIIDDYNNNKISEEEMVERVSEIDEQLKFIDSTLEENVNKRLKSYRNWSSIIRDVSEKIAMGFTPKEAYLQTYESLSGKQLFSSLSNYLLQNINELNKINIFGEQNIEIDSIPDDFKSKAQELFKEGGVKFNEENLKTFYSGYVNIGKKLKEDIDKINKEVSKKTDFNILERVKKPYSLAGYTDIEAVFKGLENVPLEQLNVTNENLDNYLKALMKINLQKTNSVVNTIGNLGNNLLSHIKPDFLSLDFLSSFTTNLFNSSSLIKAGYLFQTNDIFEINEKLEDATSRLLRDKIKHFKYLKKGLVEELNDFLKNVEKSPLFSTSQTLEEISQTISQEKIKLPQELGLKIAAGREEEKVMQTFSIDKSFQSLGIQPLSYFQQTISQHKNSLLSSYQSFLASTSYKMGKIIMPNMDAGIDFSGMFPSPDIQGQPRILEGVKSVFSKISIPYIQWRMANLENLYESLNITSSTNNLIEALKSEIDFFKKRGEILQSLSDKNNLQSVYEHLKSQYSELLPSTLKKEFKETEFKEFLSNRFKIKPEEFSGTETIKQNSVVLNNLEEALREVQTGTPTIGNKLKQTVASLQQGLSDFGRTMGMMGSWIISMPLLSSFWMVGGQPTQAAMQTTQPIFYGLGGLTGGTLFLQEFMNFIGSMPQRLIQIQEQTLTLSTLFGSKYLGEKALQQTLEIARIQPIQYEEAAQTLTAFTVFPETRPFMKYPLFQKKALETVELLSMLLPEQGTEGAIFAIRELLSNQFRSIERRFNISRELLASYAGVTPSEFKNISGAEKLSALHKALSELFAGGEEILLQRGAMFDVQIKNFTDTLLQSLVPKFTIEEQPAITKFTRQIFTNQDGSLKENLLEAFLGETWQSYKRIAGKYIQSDAENKKELQSQYAFELLSENTNTVAGMLSLMFSGLNNLFANFVEKSNLGELLSSYIIKIVSPIMGKGGVFEKWSKVDFSSLSPNDANRSLLLFFKDLLEGVNTGIQYFGQMLNTNEVKNAFHELASVLMNAMIETVQVPMKIATVAGAKFTLMFPKIIGETISSGVTEGLTSAGGAGFVDIASNVLNFVGLLYTIRGFRDIMNPTLGMGEATSSLLKGVSIPLIPQIANNLISGNYSEGIIQSLMLTGSYVFPPIMQKMQQFYSKANINTVLESPYLGLVGILPQVSNVFTSISDEGMNLSNVLKMLGVTLQGASMFLPSQSYKIATAAAGLGLSGIGAGINKNTEIEDWVSLGASAIGMGLTFIPHPAAKVAGIGLMTFSNIIGKLISPLLEDNTKQENIDNYLRYIRHIDDTNKIRRSIMTNFSSFFKNNELETVNLLTPQSFMSLKSYANRNLFDNLFKNNSKDFIENVESFMQSYSNLIFNPDLKKYRKQISTAIESATTGDFSELYKIQTDVLKTNKSDVVKQNFEQLLKSIINLQQNESIQPFIKKFASLDLNNSFIDVIASYNTYIPQHINKLLNNEIESYKDLGSEELLQILGGKKINEQLKSFATDYSKMLKNLPEDKKMKVAEIIRKNIENPQIENIDYLLKQTDLSQSIKESIVEMLKNISNFKESYKSGLKSTSAQELNTVLNSLLSNTLDISNSYVKYFKNFQSVLHDVFNNSRFYLLSKIYFEPFKAPESPTNFPTDADSLRSFNQKMYEFAGKLQEWLKNVFSISTPDTISSIAILAGGDKDIFQKSMQKWMKLQYKMLEHPDLLASNPQLLLKSPQLFQDLLIFGSMYKGADKNVIKSAKDKMAESISLFFDNLLGEVDKMPSVKALRPVNIGGKSIEMFSNLSNFKQFMADKEINFYTSSDSFSQSFSGNFLQSLDDSTMSTKSINSFSKFVDSCMLPDLNKSVYSDTGIQTNIKDVMTKENLHIGNVKIHTNIVNISD